MGSSSTCSAPSHLPALALRRALLASTGRVSLVFIDVVGVGAINRRLGRSAGDLLLRAFEDRLDVAEGRTGKLWRLGGDQFALLIPRRSAWSSVRHVRSLQRQLAGETTAVTQAHDVSVRFRAGGATVAGATSAVTQDLWDAAAVALRYAKRDDAAVVWARPTASVALNPSKSCRIRVNYGFQPEEPP